MNFEFSILMPCLNESRSIGRCIEQAKKLIHDENLNAEIVVADNFSTDGSQEIARSLGARVVDVRARGYGAAIANGIQAARAPFIILADSDASYDFSMAGPIVRELRNGSDLVIGNRFAGGIRPGAMPWSHRYFGVPVLSWIGRVVSGSSVRDFHCGLRGFKRDALLKLGIESPAMEYATEMIIRAGLAGLRISEVPVVLFPDGRGGGKPHLKTIPDGWNVLMLMLSFLAQRRKIRLSLRAEGRHDRR